MREAKPLTADEIAVFRGRRSVFTAEEANRMFATIEQQREQIVRLQQVWQPIETAPKDGTEILLGVFRDDFEDVTIMNSCWIEAEERSRWADWHGMPYPTHWRPLPAPPSEALTTTEPQT